MSNIIRQFLRMEAAGGVILIIAAIVALIMANSPLQGIYQAFLDIPVTLRFSELLIDKPLLLWINDGLMACLLYTSPSPRDRTRSRMPSSA